jgi:tetratricopeptide (TPR) repeat protein
VGRHKVGVSLAAAVLLLIVGFSVTVTVFWQQAVRERQKAEVVSEFLVNIFTSSDPQEAHGEKITARELLDTGVNKIDQDLAGQPELRAALTETMGRAYRGLGLYKRSRKLLEKSLRLYRGILSGDDLRIAHNLHNLANVLRNMSEDAAAEPHIREALEIQRKGGETQNRDYAAGLTNLGALLEERGQFDEAEMLYEKSLAIKRALPKADPEDITKSLNSLGKLAQNRRNYTLAKPYYEESLGIRRKLAKGRPDSDVALALNNLATLLEDLGDRAEAERLYRETLAMRRKLLGDRHPNVATSLNNLAFILLAEGHPQEAEPLAREALSIADERLPAVHTIRGTFLRNLAAVLVAQGKGREAETLVREALAIFREKQPDSWRVADIESVLGSCLVAQGRFVEAEPILLRSYPILKADPGTGSSYAPAALQRILDLYNAWGRPERAAAWSKGSPAQAP